MKLLLATNHLGLGGSESYLLTVAEQLDRLGHEAVIYAPEPGGGVAIALERGLVVVGEAELPEDCDAALVQDPGVSFQVADRCPSLPQLFVAHSEIFDLQAPPQLDGAVGIVVALNDRIANRLGRFAVDVEVVRLSQPIDTERFLPRGSLPEVPRRALMLSNAPNGDRFAMLESACADAGLELTQLGGTAGHAADPRAALFDAEIVIGYGRSILEAMACGRAAYVYDWNGGDGWMTAESYPEIEADGISGRSGRLVVDPARLSEDLRRYSASMGPVNHDLVIAHHRAGVHAQRLLGLFERLAPPARRPRGPLQEMARLVRLEWRARVEVQALGQENAHLRGLLMEADRERRETFDRARGAEAERDEAVAAAMRSYEATTSWRLTAPLRAAGRMIRRARRRRRR
jgi:hypothetical protein